MTDQEWLACDDPERLLAAVEERAGERKLLLLACACCRQAWSLLLLEPSRRAVEVAERFADGEARIGEPGDAGSEAYDAELSIEAVVNPPSAYDVAEDTMEEIRQAIRRRGTRARRYWRPRRRLRGFAILQGFAESFEGS